MEEKLIALLPDYLQRIPYKNLEDYFDNPKNMNQENVEKYVIEMFRFLTSNDELIPLIKKFCDSQNDEEKFYHNINFKNLAKQYAHRFHGGCLIATKKTIEFGYEYFYDCKFA